MRTLAIIPARKGSKGLPGKNVRVLAGRPLIEWTIDAALRSKYVTEVVITTDDPKIFDMSVKFPSIRFLRRPEPLASDSASSVDVVDHVISNVDGFDCFVLLQPTSPLRSADDIDRAFELMLAAKSSSCVGIKQVTESPWWMYERSDSLTLSPIVATQSIPNRRQDLPLVYMPNGSLYICTTIEFLRSRAFITTRTIGYEMPQIRSVDIDDLDDFNECEQLMVEHFNS
jgi:CMP-N,N'-diacetyllegionaminic acid synthase